MIGYCNWCRNWEENLSDNGFCQTCVDNHVDTLVDELEAISEDNDPHTLEKVKGEEAIRAYKAADIAITLAIDPTKFSQGPVTRDDLNDIESAQFVPCAQRGLPYTANGVAECPHVKVHDTTRQKVPVVSCSCGFYAWKKISMLDEYVNSAKLQVDLSGKVIEATKGYRAENQQVMRVDFPHTCLYCAKKAVSLCINTSCIVVPMCEEHADFEAVSLRRISTAELSNLLETEVIWEPHEIESKATKQLKKFVPYYLAIGVAMSINAAEIINNIEYYASIVLLSFAHIPYVNWLKRKQSDQYFKIPDR